MKLSVAPTMTVLALALGCSSGSAPVDAPEAEPTPEPKDILADYRDQPVDLGVRREAGDVLTVSKSERAWGITRLTGLTTLDRNVAGRHDFTVEILEVDAGEPTRVRLTHDRMIETTTLTLEGSPPMSIDTELPLHGLTELQVLTDSKWTRTLEQGTPTMEQSLLLRPAGAYYAAASAWFPADLDIGARWTVEGPALTSMFGGNVIEEPKGSVGVKLLGLTEHEGEPCAKLRSKGGVQAHAFNPDDPKGYLDVRVELKATSLRNLDTRITVTESSSGTVESSGRLRADDRLVQFTMSGQFESTITTTVR